MKRILPLALALFLAAPALAFTGRIVNLGDAQITAAVSGQVITSSVSSQSIAISYVDRLEGITAATFQATFAYGSSGGTTVKVDIKTSMDSGVTWLPVCRFAFTTSSAQKVANVSGLTPRLTAAVPVTLSDDACFDGTIGNLLRAEITTTGTYVGATTVSIRASLR